MNVTHKRPRAAPSPTPCALAAGGRPVPARWAAADSAGDPSPLWQLLVDHGSREMLAPGISALDHALHCATLAQEAGTGAALVTASLLHDIGHLLRADFCVSGLSGARDRHAMIGAAFLSLWFGPAVTEPVRLHGEAKRYLCRTEPGYLARLHAGAQSSLARNGGPMSHEEARAFLDGPHAREAILLRRWDDRAGRTPLKTGRLSRFRSVVQSCLA